MVRAARVLPLLSLLLTGAIFGFFYAWVCSTMWGLDAADPRVAIEAMQAMNASVRNPVFAPAFFGTPVVCLATGGLLHVTGLRHSAACFALAGAIYMVGGIVPTLLFNVPMNEALATIQGPLPLEAARAVWQAYSPRWQDYNLLRTAASGVALLFVGAGLLRLGRGR
ncbi:MAG: DUF1772 domain-containing protein [Alphaproteobacteria bacterium]|nr:DUF1772 domain-containing protein [Alphaproteobacteria bacterium]